jgi:mono/diheme cytochrome c family protein
MTMMMRTSFLRRAAGFVVAAALLAPVPARAASAAKPDGKDLWSTHCILCHGETGAPGPQAAKLGVANLSLAKWQASRTDDQIRKIITEGKQDTLMRPFGDDLTKEEIDALVTYVRGLGKAAASKKK